MLNDSNDLYVEDDTPQGETEYRARFYVNPAGVTMGSGDVLDLFDGYNDTTHVLGVQMQQVGDVYQIRGGILDNGTTWHYTGWYALTDGWNAVELSYQALVDDGAITLWLNGVSQQSLSRVDNDTRTLTAGRLGAQGIAAATRGTLYFDEFESRRFSYIGTLPEPDLPLGEPVSEPGWAARTYSYDAEHPHAVSAVTPDTGTPDTYSYDQDGNMTCRMENGSWFIQGYNAENRLSVVQRVASGDCANPATFSAVWNFAYDGDGTRVAQAYTPYDESGTPGTPVFTEYFMGGAYEVADGAVKKYYAIAGMTVAMQDGSGLQYLLTDHLGSIVAVTDASGTLTSQQRYLPFGEVRSDVGSIAETDLAYTGQRAVDSLGLLDYHARFYDAALGRFISPDSIVSDPANPQALNRYSYTLNNPIRYNDPTGHRVCDDMDAMGNCITAPGSSSGGLGGGVAGNNNRDGRDDESDSENTRTHNRMRATIPCPICSLLPDTYYVSFSVSAGIGPLYGAWSFYSVTIRYEVGSFSVYSLGPGFDDKIQTLPRTIRLEQMEKTWMTPQIGVTLYGGVLQGLDDVKQYQGPSKIFGASGGHLAGGYFEPVDRWAGKPKGELQG